MAALAVRAARVRLVTYEVEGRSMLPALRPGDWVIVDRGGATSPGTIVLAPDPREPQRTIAKRVAGIEGGAAWLLGDNPPASTDSRTFGAVPLDELQGRVRWRYWPPPLGPVR